MGDYYTREHSSWDYVKFISLPANIKAPRLYCVASDDNVVLVGDTLRGLVYDVNLQTEKITKKPLQGDVMDCAMTPDGTLYASESPSGCIGVYAKNGKRVREIRVSGVASPCTLVIDVDKDGLIVAGNLCGGSNEVHFLNPSTGEILRTATLSDGEEIRGEIRVTTSGLVVVKACEDGFVILDGETAKVRSTLKRKEWAESRCAVDPASDILCVCSLQESKTTSSPVIAVVEEVAIDGRSKNKEPITFKQLTRPVIAPLITSRGQMIVCNGKDLLIYKKAFMYENAFTKPEKKWVKV